MKMYKKSENVEFEVIYADGSTRHVSEGILFEACQDHTTQFHIGTNRKSVFVAFFKASSELADYIITKFGDKEGR